MAKKSSKLIPPPRLRSETHEVFEELDHVGDLRAEAPRASTDGDVRPIDSSSLLKAGSWAGPTGRGAKRLANAQAARGRAKAKRAKPAPKREARPPVHKGAWHKDGFTLCAIGIAGVLAVGLLTWLATLLLDL